MPSVLPAPNESDTGASRRVLTLEDVWSIDRLGAPAVSPDGHQVVFTVTRFSKEDNKSTTDLWLVPSDGGAEPRRLTWNPGNDSGARWSPDGRSLAFISSRVDDEPAQLYRLPLDGGEAEPLTELPIAVRDFRWFPDGRRIALVAATFPGLDDDFERVAERVQELKDDKTRAKISDRRLLRYWDSYRTDASVPHVFVLDLESREVRDLMPGLDALMGFQDFSWDLAPGGEEIAYEANGTEPPWRELAFDVYLLDVATGRRRNLTGELDGWGGAPCYTPDGRYLLLTRTLRPNNSADFRRLARYDRATGELLELTSGAWDGEPVGLRTTRDGRTVVFHAQNRGRLSLYTLSIDGGTPRMVVEGGSTRSVDVGGDGQLVFVSESITEPGEITILDAGAAQTRKLTSLAAGRLAGVELGRVEDMSFEGAGGAPVQMWVALPPGFDEERKWPLVVLIHGGPHGAWNDAFHYRWTMPLFAAQGWVAAAVNFHGSMGFGQAFAESIVGNHPDKPFVDVMKATDLLIERGWVDENRMAAAGGSFGGYMTSWILGHTDRYAALVNHAGVYDLMAQFASDHTWNRGHNYGATPWEDPEKIDRVSPSRYAKHFKTPMLILHGELDFRVPVTQAINLHHVLTGKGVPSRIVIFPGEGHWILKPQAAEIWWREVIGWLTEHIGRGPSEA